MPGGGAALSFQGCVLSRPPAGGGDASEALLVPEG